MGGCGGRLGTGGVGFDQFGFEGLEFGFGDVTAEGFGEVVLQVAFGLGLANPNGFGPDAVGAQALGEPKLGDFFALDHLRPGMVGEPTQAFHQVAAEDAIGAAADEQEEDVEEQGANGAVVLGTGGETEGGLTGEGRPVCAGEVGEGEQGFPDVGGAVVEAGRKVRGGVGDGLVVIEDEAGALAAEGGGVEISEALTGFVGGLALHADDDAAVGEGVGEAANGGDGFGAPGGEAGEGGVWSVERGAWSGVRDAGVRDACCVLRELGLRNGGSPHPRPLAHRMGEGRGVGDGGGGDAEDESGFAGVARV